MKKLIFAFILILLCIVSLPASAQGLFSSSFESEQEALLWSGGIFDESISFEKGFSLFVNNPFGEVRNDTVTHVLDYASRVYLEAGKVYTLSGYAMNPLSPYTPSARTSAQLSTGANTIVVNVSGIGDEWSKFSTTFYVGASMEYNLSIHFAQGYVDFGFFVDELVLEETKCILSSLVLRGQSEVLIPASGSIKNYYRPYIVTSDNKSVEIISDSSIYFSVTQSAGVSFNPTDFSLTITSEALSGTNITIDCALRNYANLPPVSLSVLLTDNMVNNSTFQHENEEWTSSSVISDCITEADRYISLPTNDYGDYGYFATLNYNTPQILLQDVLYVMTLRIKSDSIHPFSAIHAMNTAEAIGDTVYFNIKDISGDEWIDAFAAFVPETTGIYNIALNLYSMHDCTIYADDIKLSSEVLKPQYITLHAPGNIALPNVATSYPVSALLRDQLGNIIPTDEISITLKESGSSIYFDNETSLITVHPDAPSGEYTLFAQYKNDPSIKGELKFTVSFQYFGDGDFEKTIPNQWWMVSSPFEYDFYIRHDGYSRRALINSSGNYFMLLNNSYVHLMEGVAYVFGSSFAAATDCTATLFIETVNSEVIPLAQVFIPAGSTLDNRHAPELFLAENDCVGRLFLYIQSENGQPFSVYADNLSLKIASIVAANAHYAGKPSINGAVSAEFVLYNNIAENSDSSACAINWYSSDSPYQGYSEIVSSEKNIYFDTTFLNKYVYFEVIPICPVTGFSGNPIRCMPFLVTYDTLHGTVSPAMFEPVISYISPAQDDFFSDTQLHWGKNYINTLAQNGIANGKGDNNFHPDEAVSRAEFSKMLSVAFNIKLDADFSSFTDVYSGDWYYPYVSALNLAGIVKGTSPTTFSPHSHISRESAAAMLVRLYEKATESVISLAKVNFTDAQSISLWAQNEVCKAVYLGLLQGYSDNTFAAEKLLSRAEAAALICRLSQIL